MAVEPKLLLVSSHLIDTWRIDPPEQPYWRMYWNAEPGATVIATGRRLALTPDRVVLISPDTVYQGELSRPVRHTYVHFLLGRPADAAHGLVVPVALDPVRRRQLAAMAGQAYGLGRELIALSVLTWAASTLPEGAWPGPPADARIAAAQHALATRLADPPSNAELAATAGLHPHAFDRLFRRHTGSSPHAWGLRRRLDEACRRLMHGREPVASIARACGFADHRHFGVAFRRRFDESPMQFRRHRTPGCAPKPRRRDGGTP